MRWNNWNIQSRRNTVKASNSADDTLIMTGDEK